jgi:hypothetical protein
MVTLKRVPGELRLTVADDGQGLDPRRADTGLGRRLVDGFAQQLAGQVERKSDSRGTRVHLILPSREGSELDRLPGHRERSGDDRLAGNDRCKRCQNDEGDEQRLGGYLRRRLARIPTKGADSYDREKYKWRHLIENFFCRIKAFRRTATRYEKTDTCFAAMIYAVNILITPF